MDAEKRITFGVGSHEPIWHRMRTGNTTREEWERWERETSDENLDLLEKLGVTSVHIACSKGFGLEMEKPLIERAARFAEKAARRGISTSIYVQGFPVYYETFLLEKPQAEAWFARTQTGDYIPWGGQTFRRWIDPTIEEFRQYLKDLIAYILEHITPTAVGIDNTRVPPSYTESSRESFRRYLKEKFADADIEKEFGIPSFDAVDLPRFDPVYYPPDAMRIVKDPLLQEWARWRSHVIAAFLKEYRELIRSIAPGVKLSSGAGCDGLRYNHLFNRGVDFDDWFSALDDVHMEESWWRPGVIEPEGDTRTIIMDERTPDRDRGMEKRPRISTDSRWWKIAGNYGRRGHYGFWGEFERQSKLVVLAHNMTFSQEPSHLGTIGPLAASPRMIDDIKDVIEWENRHIGILTGRDERFAPVGVWRGTATIGFIRHTPVWEACAVEQMLYENHIPFTILLDGSLDGFLERGPESVLVLPGTACVSDAQVERITAFVEKGGALLLLGSAGTRDERTRLRTRYAFEHLFGGTLPELERIGPPHWVPELDMNALPETASACFGKGRVALVKRIVPPHPLDLSRDPYMPERQVMVKDIVPPANEETIMQELERLLGDTYLHVEGPRWVLCEYWRRGRDLLVCCANMSTRREGGPVKIVFGPYVPAEVEIYTLFEEEKKKATPVEGRILIESVEKFTAVLAPGVFA